MFPYLNDKIKRNVICQTNKSNFREKQINLRHLQIVRSKQIEGEAFSRVCGWSERIRKVSLDVGKLSTRENNNE